MEENTPIKSGQANQEGLSKEQICKMTVEDYLKTQGELNKRQQEVNNYCLSGGKTPEKKEEPNKPRFGRFKKLAGCGLLVLAGAISGWYGRDNEPAIKNQVQHQYTALEQKVTDISTRVGNAASELGGAKTSVENAEHTKAYNALMQNLAQSIQSIEQQMSPEEFQSFCTDVYAVFEKYNSSSVNVNDVTKVEGGKENVQK